jgi:DNA-binding beta-propeller fold protein YncE
MPTRLAPYTAGFALLILLAPLAYPQTAVVVEEGLGRVVEADTRDPDCRAEIAVGLKPHEIALSPDGRTAYVSNFGLLEANFKVGVAGKTISVIDVARAAEIRKFTLPDGPLAAPHGVKLRPNATELFTNAEIGDTMLVFDTNSGKILRTFPVPPGVHNFIFSPDGSALYAFSIKGQVFRIDAATGKMEVTASIESPRGLAWAAGNASLIVSGKGQLRFLDPKTLAAIRTFDNLDVHQIFYPSASPNGKLIFAPAVLDGVTLVLDAATGKVLHRLQTGSPLLVAFAPNADATAWISNVHIPQEMLPPASVPRPGGVFAVDLATFNTTPLPTVEDANGLAISAIAIKSCSLHPKP